MNLITIPIIVTKQGFRRLKFQSKNGMPIKTKGCVFSPFSRNSKEEWSLVRCCFKRIRGSLTPTDRFLFGIPKTRRERKKKDKENTAGVLGIAGQNGSGAFFGLSRKT